MTRTPNEEQIATLHQVLSDVFDEAGLRQMVRQGMNESVDKIAEGENLSDQIFGLIDWAIEAERLPELVDAARQHQPENVELNMLDEQLASVAMPSEVEKTFTEQVFLSYSSRDANLMRRIRKYLRANGITVWSDDKLVVGTSSWPSAIESALRSTQCMVVLLSPNAKASEWVQIEIAQKRELGHPVFPVLVEGEAAEAVPLMLKTFQLVDARNDLQTAITSELIPTLVHELNLLGVVQQVTATTKSENDIQVTIDSAMKYVPTGYYASFDQTWNPLVVCTIHNGSKQSRRLRVTTKLDGYTHEAIEIVQVKSGSTQTIRQLPALLQSQTEAIHTSQRATLMIDIEDWESGAKIEEFVQTVILLPRTQIIRSIKDAGTGEIHDYSRFLASYVTPTESTVMDFLRNAAEHHHKKQLRGYQDDVESQIQAIYDAVKEDLQIAYVHHGANINIHDNVRSQHIQLPRECISRRIGNAVDVSLLFASLIEAINLNPALCIVPRHIFVGWQTKEDGDEWAYLETTMLQTNSFQEARQVGTSRSLAYKKRFEATDNPQWFQQLNVGRLRTLHGILPLE